MEDLWPTSRIEHVFFIQQRGVAVIEFAVVLPVILLLLLGTVYYGYAFVLKNSVQQAAGNAAAQAAQSVDGSAQLDVDRLRAVVLASLQPMPASAVDVSVTLSGSTGCVAPAAGAVRVVLDTDVDGVMPFQPALVFGVRVPPGVSRTITEVACFSMP